MSNSVLLGLGGRAGAGKDAIADYLVAEHGFVTVGMSDPLHEALLTLNPILIDTPGRRPVRYADAAARVGYVELKARYPEARRLQQVFGTDVGREMFGPNVWVDVMARKVAAHQAEGRNVVVTGIRFPNELSKIRGLGGLTWWVERPGVNPAAGHVSESSVSSTMFGDFVANVGTLDDLFADVRERLNERKEQK